MAEEAFLTLGWSGISWVEHYLVHGPGDVEGQPIELDDEFAAFILKAYRLKPDGQRMVRRAFLSRPKGRSKSGLAAMLACFEALGPARFDHFAEAGEVSPWGYEYDEGEPVGRQVPHPEVLNVATEEGQAGNTYDAIYFMLNPDTCSDALLEDYGRIDVGLTRINLPDGGFIEPVTSSDSSKDGGKSTFIVADETHLWVLPRLKRLHGIMTRNLLKRKVASGWMLETSTMYGEGEESVAEGTHAYAKSLENGRKKDHTLLFDHQQASDKWDLNKRSDRMKALKEAYGPAAAWMNLAAICDSWDDPQVTEADFRRYWLNQPVLTGERTPSPIDVSKWHQLGDPARKVQPERIAVFAVESDLDLSWSSIGGCGQLPDGRMHVGLLDRKLGTSWLKDACLTLARDHPGARFVVDGGGPASFLISTLELAKLEVVIATTADVAQASAGMVEAVKAATVSHWAETEIDAAVEGARKRVFRDGGFAFGRLKSDVDVTPLVAVTLARWAALIPPKPPPEVWSLREMVAQMRAEQAETPPETGQPSQPQQQGGQWFTPL